MVTFWLPSKYHNTHCVKNVQIRSIFYSVFSRIQSEYGKIRTRKNSAFGHLSHNDRFENLSIFSFSYKSMALK